jgi:uncharacterized Zn-finger protein
MARQSLRCSVCDKKWDRKDHLERHGKVFSYPYAFFQFTNLQLERTHRIVRISCNYCDKVCTRHCAFVQHLKKHTPPKCKKCTQVNVDLPVFYVPKFIAL